MANARSRLKAPKSAPTKRNERRKTISSTGPSHDIKPRRVMKRPSNLRIVGPEEKVHYILKNKQLDKVEENKRKPRTRKDALLNKNCLVTKNGLIKNKNKCNLKLVDNILKSELNIIDNNKNSKLVKKRKDSNNSGSNNNNDNTISDQNTDVSPPNNAKNCKKPVVNKRTKISRTKNDDINKKCAQKSQRSVKKKQVTLSNGLVLTLSLFQCDHCGKTFSNKSSIRRHMYVHLGIKPYTCKLCSKKFSFRFAMQAHMKKHHSNEENVPEHYMCHICNKPFLLKENLSLHLTSHLKNENAFKCIYCNKKFSHHLLLVKHEKQHLVTGQYQCSICNLSYDSRTQFALHIKSHMKIRDYVCQYCGKDFLRLNSMRRHVQICHGGHRIQCPICKKSLKGHLTEHMRTHENERPHKCPDCGQCFTQSTQLTVHRRSHSGARPYSCRICKRPFSHSNALMLHIRRHTGEKPFACAMCPISFSQLPHMKAHMRNIHGKNNPYKCQKCNQFFKLKVEVENHVKSCTVGDRELSFEEKLEASTRIDDSEIESVMTLSRMRYLLALLLTMIATKEKLKYLGFNKRLVDDLLVESLEAMGHPPCKDESLTPLKRLKTNIGILLNGTVPKEQMEKFQSEKKSTEELLELLTNEKKKN